LVLTVPGTQWQPQCCHIKPRPRLLEDPMADPVVVVRTPDAPLAAPGTVKLALPDDGDLVEFESVEVGSLILATRPQPPVAKGETAIPPVRVRYRVEHKPMEREYLLVDVLTGHAHRVAAHEFKRGKWGLVTHEQLDKEAALAKQKLEAEKPAAVSLGQPLASSGSTLFGGVSPPGTP
jgi:hypothetical protein